MSDPHDPMFNKLINFLARFPAIKTNESPFGGFGTESNEQGWWLKFQISIDYKLAWRTVQELSYVLNGLSLSGALPTIFKPVSPPPYLNGGPEEYLSWVIECSNADMRPGTIADWLEGRLPNPVDDVSVWLEES